jgi:hypothetical protein
MDITKKHNTEIYKDEQHGHHLLIFIYFCFMFSGDVGHVAHLYIFLCNVFGDVHVAHLYIFLCYVLQHNTEIYKDEQHGHHQKT